MKSETRLTLALLSSLYKGINNTTIDPSSLSFIYIYMMINPKKLGLETNYVILPYSCLADVRIYRFKGVNETTNIISVPRLYLCLF